MRRLGITVVGLLLARGVALAQQYDSGDPSPQEQFVLEVINRARSNPFAEGTRLGPEGLPNGDITEGLVAPDNQIGARPPLAMNKTLSGTARSHNMDMYHQNFFGHNSSNGDTFDVRISKAGYAFQKVGENIAEASGPSGQVNETAAGFEDLLMIDAGIPGRGHRLNLLDAYGGTLATPFFREIGIAYDHFSVADSAGMTDLMTQDFGVAQPPLDGPFLLGVIYSDANGNNFYDPGEGISGITIQVSGTTAFAVSATAGGYVVPIGGLSGTVTVTLSGGSLSAPFSTDVALGSENVKVDFIIQSGTARVAPSSVFPPAPPPSKSSSHRHCGATGVELLVFLALGRRFRLQRRSRRSMPFPRGHDRP